MAGPVGDSAEDVLELELQGQNSSSQLETRQKGPKIGAKRERGQGFNREESVVRSL